MFYGIATFLSFWLVLLFVQRNEAKALETTEARILNGTIVSIFQAPYVVSVRLKSLEAALGYGYGHICTGAVISQRMVLTAAVCRVNQNSSEPSLYSSSDLTLVMGSMYLYRKDFYSLQYNVQKVVALPQFSYPNSSLYDMAAMFIDGYIPWNWPTVSAVGLSLNAVLENEDCFLSGWGKPPSNLQNVSGILQQLELPIMNDAACENFFETFTPAMFCAGYSNFSGLDACTGDAGAPLICQGLLTGVASWENGCLNVPYRGFYGNVSFFHNWILSTNASFNYTSFEKNISQKTGGEPLALILICLFLSLAKLG